MRTKLRQLALLLLIVGSLVAIPKWWNATREAKLHARIKSELLEELPELAAEDWRLYLDGSQGVIHGTISSQALFAEADELISVLSGDGPDAIRGLDSLKCALSVPYDSSLELSVNDESGAINVTGAIPAEALAMISKTLTLAFPSGKITDDIQIASGKVVKAPWAEQFSAIVPSLVRSVGDLSIKLQGRAITINGRVASEATRNQIQELLLNQFGGSIDYVRNGLTTLEGQLETSFLTLEFSTADTIVLGGRIQSRSTRDQLVRGIEAIAPAGFLVEDRTKIRPAATGSWWLRPTLAFLPEAFDSLQGSEIRVDASGVELRGLQMGADEQATINTLVKSYFPEETYSFASERDHNFNPQDADPDPDSNPVQRPQTPLVAATENSQTETPVGDQVEVGPNDSSDLQQLIADTQIFFNSGSTRLRETESEKIAILAEQLSNHPELKLDVSGLADPTGNAAANRRLAQKRCAAVLVALEGSGIDPSRLRIIGGGETSPKQGEPSWKLRRVEFSITPKQLIASSPESVTATHIYFERNSTRLTREEQSKLDSVARILKEDTPGLLAIAGFTDSNGNRSYNERLSKLRCQAVHEYLISQGVSDDRLKMQPGGELSSSDSSEPSWKKRRVQFQWVELAASR